MSEEGSQGNLWGNNNSWVFSNSDQSGGSQEKLGMKPPKSSSNSPSALASALTGSGQKRVRKGTRKNDQQVGEGESGGCKAVGEAEHEIHIWTERERRKKMRNMFASLHALLPHLPDKADKSTIVDEAVNYITSLQQSYQTLQKQKQERLPNPTIINREPPPPPPSIVASQLAATLETRKAFVADTVSSRSFSLADHQDRPAHQFSLPFSPTCFQTWFSPNVVMSVCGVDAQISVCSLRKPGLLAAIFYILEKHKLDVVSAHVSSDHCRGLYMIHARAGGASSSNQFVDQTVTAEEIFKLAVGEMSLWLSSC